MSQQFSSACESYSIHWESNDSGVVGHLHPQLLDWVLGFCKDYLDTKGYCERDSGNLEFQLLVWLSTKDRVVYEEMFTGSPHQLGVAIPHDLGYRSEKIETLRYVNVMMIMKSNTGNLIWNNCQSLPAKHYKTNNAEKRTKKMVKKLLKGIPSSSDLV